MIAPRVVDEVGRLLAAGELSQRKIAVVLGISRGTVTGIALGRRPDYEAMRRARAEEETTPPAGPSRRCPGCGGMVATPCRACATRAAAGSVPGFLTLGNRLSYNEPLALELRGKHRRRYEEVRAARLATEPEADPTDFVDTPQPDDDDLVLEPAQLWDALDYDDEQPVPELEDWVAVDD
ncbi:MAG: hypothetical protein HQ567_15215 [Candidatus Nealsonbacteria bacterium]|nr:hypothetical protein [Candidatus Nealsonbacteria bacterium]